MAKIRYMTAPSDRLNGIIIEKDGKRFLDTRIGVLLELDDNCPESTGRNTSVEFNDCNHDIWAGSYTYLKEITEASERLDKLIKNKEHFKVRIKDKTIVEEYKNSGQIPSAKNIQVTAEDLPFNFFLQKDQLICAEDKHYLFNGEEIEVLCDFGEFDWKKSSIHYKIKLTPRIREKGERPEIGKTYQGYIINCNANFGIFVECQGWVGLIYKKHLYDSFTEDCKNGTVCSKYPVGGKIEVTIEGIVKKDGEERISMVLTDQKSLTSSLITDKEIELRISRVDYENGRLLVSWQEKELNVFWQGDGYFFLKQRVKNRIYKEQDKIKGRVMPGNGTPIFVMSKHSVQYGIEKGEIVCGRLYGTFFRVSYKGGQEKDFMVRKNDWLAPEIAKACSKNSLIIEAECCELSEYGDPIFSVRSRMKTLGEELMGTTISAEVVTIAGNFIVWKHDHLVGIAQLRNTILAYNPGDRISIAVTNQKNRPYYSIDERAATWDNSLAINPGDTIDAHILAEISEGHYSIAYNSIIGTYATRKKHELNEKIKAKVVYFDLSEKRLNCIEECPSKELPEQISGADVCIISHISQRHWWVSYGEDIYMMHLDNDYPSHICRFLFKSGNIVSLDIKPDGLHRLRATHPYDHSRINSLEIETGTRIGAQIEGYISDGMILSYNGVYCIMPYELVDWNSHIYFDKESYPVGRLLMATVKNKTASGIYLNHLDCLENQWTSSGVTPGEELTCTILKTCPDGSVIVKADNLVGIIEKEFLSWFNFIETDRFAAGKTIKASIMEFNLKKRILTLRATDKASPWSIGFKTGDICEVSVVETYASSIVVKTDNGLEGSMTIEDLTILPYEDCRLLANVGDRFNAVITGRYDNQWRVTFRKTGIYDTTRRNELHPGQTIRQATVIKVNDNGVYFDLGNNICGILPHALIGEMVEGYKPGDPLDTIFHPASKKDVKICRLVQNESKTYVTDISGSVFYDIPLGKMNGTVVGKTSDHMVVRFSYNDHDHLARIHHIHLRSAWDHFLYEIGDVITFALIGFDKNCWAYTGKTNGVGMNPWTAGGHPKEGDIRDAEIIGFSKGKAVVSIKGITSLLSKTELLTDTPWVPCGIDKTDLKIGSSIKVAVSEYNGSGRIIKLIPYTCGYKDDIRNGRLRIIHTCKEGLYAYCDSYGCCCFIPKDELFWCPVDNAESLFSIGDTFDGEMIRYDLEIGMPVMSRKRLLAPADSEIHEGDFIEGQIRKVTEDAVILLCGTFENVVNLRHMTWDPMESLEEDYIGKRFRTGDSVKAKVIARIEDDITLSIRETMFNPWTYCSLNDTIAQATITRTDQHWIVAEYGSLFKVVIREWNTALDPKVGNIAAVRFYNLDRASGHMEGELINILPDEFRKHIIPDTNILCHIEHINDEGAAISIAEGKWTGFIPKEEWSWTERETITDSDIGTDIHAKIIDIDYHDLSVRLSRKRAKGLPADLCPISVGETAEVVIKDVHTGNGRDSLYVTCAELPYLKGSVPYKELGWLSSDKSAAGYRPGETITVEITAIDYKKISFKASIRKLHEDNRKIADINQNERLEVTIEKFVNQKFYADVRYGRHKGVLHLDKEYWQNIEGHESFFMPGREIEAVYQDFKDGRMVFFLPAEEYAFDWEENIELGSILEVKVLLLTESAILVGYKGLVAKIRKEDLSWSPKTLDIFEEYENDELLEVSVETFDTEKKHIRLSRKKLLPNPFEGLKDLKQGDRINMTVCRFAVNGIIGEYNGVTCILPYNGKYTLLQQKYIDGIPLEVEVDSIDKKCIHVLLNNEDICRAEDLTEGYGYWGEVISIDGNELTLDVEGYLGKAVIDPMTLSGSTVENRYRKGCRYWFVIENIDTAANCLVMTNERKATGNSWFMQHGEGTELYGDIVEVSVKKITVFAKGMYFVFSTDQISLFYLPDARLMYSVEDKIKLKVVSVSPLDVKPAVILGSMNELGVKTGDPVNGVVVYYQLPKKEIYIKDDRNIIYTIKMADHFNQPYIQTLLYADKSLENLTVTDMNPDERTIIVEPGKNENRNVDVYDHIKDGDLIKAVVFKRNRQNKYILKYGDWFAIMTNNEIPDGMEYDEGDEILVRVTGINRVDNTVYCSSRLVKGDPVINLLPGKEVPIEYKEILDAASGKCRIKVENDSACFECLCTYESNRVISEGLKENVFITQTDVINRMVYVSKTAPDLSKPCIGEHVTGRIKSYDQIKKNYRIEFKYRNGKTYNGIIEHDAMLWHSICHIIMLKKTIRGVITGKVDGKISVNARCLSIDPLLYLDKNSKITATVLGYDKFIGYLISFNSSIGIVPTAELLWQTCDLKGLFWSAGQKVSVCFKDINRDATLCFSHKNTYDNPFLGHTIQTGEKLRATVKRSGYYNNSPIMIVELDYTGGIEASILPESLRESFTHGTEIQLPEAGKKIHSVKIVDVKQVHPDHKWTLRITAEIESID